uniref:Golgi associated RAB2 interactor protein-like Rab2B-binding domain-containing protein n=1 Tax=Erpetoichthys calabaricus TaxID=27687 RepID=A0A8C4TB23_ERPCA
MCLMDQIPSECPVLTVSNTRLGLTAAAFKLTCNGLLRKFLRRQRLCPICDQFIFESSFVEFAESSQVSRLLDRRTVITVGITSSDPKLLQRHPADGPAACIYAGLAVVSVTIVSSETLPDLMFLGRPLHETKGETGGCLPLKDLKLSVHSEEMQLLKVELYTGLVHYLKLLAPPGRDEAVFKQWVQLVNRLKEMTTSEEGEMEEGVVTLAESPPEHELDNETLHAFCANAALYDRQTDMQGTI